jgi:hypothetical protein
VEKLKPIKNDIQTILWCGPAAISAVTGEPVSKIVAMMKHLSGKRCVKGVSTGLMQRTLTMLGWEATTIHRFDRTKVPYGQAAPIRLADGSRMTVITGGEHNYVEAKNRPTLARYCRQHREDFQEHACIIETTGHYVAIFGRRFCDNHTKEPVFLRKSPHRRARVQRVLQIKKVGGPDWKPKTDAWGRSNV